MFPYTSFTKISDADANALYDYLKGQAAVKYSAPANEMGFPQSALADVGVEDAVLRRRVS